LEADPVCFGAKTPTPKEPPPPPTERDASIEATRNRQQAAGRGGVDSTLKTGALGVSETGGARSVLGG
jgi:hypothetical protein